MKSRVLFPILCVAAVAVAVSSCASVNQKLNKENRAIFESASKDKAYPSDSVYEHRAWAVGQWATYAIRYKKIWTLQTVSIVGEDENGFWVEIESQDPNAEKSPTWVKLQIANYNPATPETIRGMNVGNMYTLDERGAQASKVVMPFGMANPWESVIEGMKLSLDEGPAEDVTAGAGQFAGCKRIDSKFEFYGFHSEGTAWFHSVVPIWGYAMQITTDGKYESKLLDFGYEGAESVLDHQNAMDPFGG